MGVGKSSTCNFLMDVYCEMNGLKFVLANDSFRYGIQVERVTTTVSQREKSSFTLMDTPGTKDFQDELSDYSIQ